MEDRIYCEYDDHYIVYEGLATYGLSDFYVFHKSVAGLHNYHQIGYVVLAMLDCPKRGATYIHVPAGKESRISKEYIEREDIKQICKELLAKINADSY